VPTLVTHGRRDRLILPAAAEMTAAAIKGPRSRSTTTAATRRSTRTRTLQSRACGVRRQGLERARWLRIPQVLRSFATRLDRAIGVFLETSTAALVIAEIVILFVGILARYVFHRPLVWSDELASILFLWLAVLGSALAFRRAENLRMTTLVNKLPPAAQRQFTAIALAASLAFLAMILPASIEHVELEAVVMTPTLDLSMTWRTLAMPIGIGLMIVLGAAAHSRSATPRDAAGARARASQCARCCGWQAAAARSRQAQPRHLLPRSSYR
jgi:TRAP-type C4-dicarboxylate transport system permease small subunit